MKWRYFDKIKKKWVSLKTSHEFKDEFDKENRANKIDKEYRLKCGIHFVSLDSMSEEDRDEVMYQNSMEVRNLLTKMEREYLQSALYKQFRIELCNEIKIKFCQMKPKVRMAMYLRWFKDMSIIQIAALMKVQNWEAQALLRKGTSYIAEFLNPFPDVVWE